jgi:hypothetical protein
VSRQRGSVPRWIGVPAVPNPGTNGSPTACKIGKFEASQTVLSELMRHACQPNPPWWAILLPVALQTRGNHSGVTAALSIFPVLKFACRLRTHALTQKRDGPFRAGRVLQPQNSKLDHGGQCRTFPVSTATAKESTPYFVLLYATSQTEERSAKDGVVMKKSSFWLLFSSKT